MLTPNRNGGVSTDSKAEEKVARDARHRHNERQTQRTRWEASLTFTEMKTYLRLREKRPDLSFEELADIVRPVRVRRSAKE